MKKVDVSKIQKQFWILNEIYPKSGAYNLFSVFKLNKPLNPEYLQEAVKTVIERHEPLRTTFEIIDNELFQIIRTPDEIDISTTEIIIGESFNEDNIHQTIINEVNRSFDLAKGPLCRFTLFNFENQVSVLSIVFHHIIVDVRSEGIFAKELSEAYNSLTKNEKIRLDSVPFQYSDYVKEINQWYSSDQYLSKLKELAKDSPDPNASIKLPKDYIENDKTNNDGSDDFFVIDKQLAEKVKVFANQNNINPYRFFLTAYAIFLRRLSNQDKVYIGLPLTNRTRPVSKSTFGCFINALPLLVDFSTEKSIRFVWNEIAESLSKLLDRQEIPFTDLVNYNRSEGDATLNPYFQTGFAFKPPMQLEFDNITAKPLKIEKSQNQTEFDFLLTLYPEGDRFVGYVGYSKQLFRRQTIDRWIEIFKKIVVQLIESPELSVSKISILTDEDNESLRKFNNTEVSIPDCLIQNLFENQTKLTPLKTAVISGGRNLTYRELDNQSNQLANYLLSLGVTPGDIVGLCTERSADMMVSVLGILKAGCCYLPMDPSFPYDRIKYMYEDSGAKVLISQSSLKGKFGHFANTAIVLTDSDKDIISKSNTVKPELNISSQSLAYIIYTSGSTGKPKGVKVTHKGVVNLIDSMSKVPGIKENDVLLAVVTLSFDMSVFELFVPLSIGATVVIASSKDTTDGQALANLIENYDVTMLQATPSLWNILLGSGWKGKNTLRAFCGGEALAKNMVRQILPKVREFWNCYGPTETTVYATCIQITDPDAPIIIGKPLNNTSIHILDKNKNQLPIGVIGEVCIGGLGVAKGYVNNTELTSEKFIPFENGQIIYKTGDLGRFLADGNIELFGRIDNQIKLRGFRIEPGEIESLLSQLPGVKEAVVKIHKFEDNDERLVAFLNVSTDFKLSNEEIKGSLSKHLPGYMIPSFFQASDSLPRLPNGKINKNALILEIDESFKEQEIDFDSLKEIHKKLYKIWESVLKTKNISPSGSFFDIGGNSLLAIRILNKIKEELGFTMSFKDFIARPTIIQSGNFIDSQSHHEEKAIELIHLSETTNLPLSFNQKRLWLISKLQPNTASYIISYNYKFSGSLNRGIFQKSIEKLFQRHYIVFSVIREVNGEPFCDIVPSKVDISFIDYSGLPESQSSEKVSDIFNADSRKIFDLENGPLYRLYLIKTGSDEYYFRISIHHIIFDGWSWSVFAKDLNEIYNSLLKGNEVNLEKLEFQQYDYAQWEKNSVGSKHEAESVEFWKKNLEGASSILNFPYDFQRTDEPSGRGRSEVIRFSKELSEKLRSISKAEGTSLFATMLSAFGIQMQKYSGEDDINIGLPVAYRPHSKLENIFGMFVNTVVVRLRYEKEYTFRNIIHWTSEAALNAIAHQDLPFEDVVEIVKPDRSSGANPLFQVALAWQNNLDEPIKLDGVVSEVVNEDERTAIFDIILYLWENGDIIEGEIDYSTDLLKRETIIRLKDNLLILINNLVENPDTVIESVPMISEEEKTMIDTVNNTFADFSEDKTIIQLFEEMALLNPEQTAIIFDEGELTYSELNLKAIHLAGVLQTYNIGVGDFVGLLLKRSPELIICLLAILKTGAAYVPLNLTDPDNRIMSIINAADIKFVITNTEHDLILPDNRKRLNIEQLISQSDSDQTTFKDTLVTSADSAYIIFTSGTTGIPKGVLVGHKSVINIIEWVNKTFKISSSDKLLWTTNLSFDLSVYDIFGILAAGATIRILSDEDRQNPEKQYNIMLKEGITFWDSAPQSLLQLVPFFNKSNNPRLYDSLRLVFLSGDWIPLSLPTAVTSIFPSAQVVGLGGATEATIWSNYFIIDKINPEWKSIPYGKPMQNARYYILDAKMNHCRIKQPGNLYIGGECLALGYYNDPNLTNSKFIQDPYNSGSKLYLTGDKAQWLPDGNIEFLGREDEQLKVRGYRVEIGEIKNTVLQNEAIKEAVIIPDKSDRHNIKVILFITTYEDITLDVRDLKKELRKSLPEYMIPADIIRYKQFPATANGKIDTKALFSDYIKSLVDDQNKKLTDGADEDLKTLSPTQKIMYEIWCESLKKVNISPKDNFFDIGGNSLLAIRLINSIKEKIGATLSFKEFITHPTIIESGDYIDSQHAAKSETINLVHLTGKENLPLTGNQKRLWLLSKLHPEIPSYIIGFTYKLFGSLNKNIFQKSIELLFQRHYTVFSLIKEVNGEPYCDIVPSKVDISFIDYSGLRESETSEKVNDILSADSRKVFDLQNGPLYRLYLIKTSNNEYFFHLSIHHIIFDGWSWSVLVKDLNNIYNSLLKGEEVVLDEIELQQYDYAQWENKSAGSKREAESVEFWKKNLEGASTILNFPYDFQHTEEPSGRGGIEAISLSEDLSDKLRRISKKENSSLFATMLSAFGIEMQKYSGEDDINIGLPVAYRPHSKLENIFGMFVNTVVVRLRYEKESTFRNIIHWTSEAALNAVAHQDLPFEKVVEIANPDRSSNANPLFQVAFAWQNNLDEPIKMDGIRSEKITGRERTSIFDITMSLWEDGSRIEGEIEYNLDVLNRDTITRLRDNFIHLLKTIVENTDLPISDINIVSDNDKKLLEQFNKTDVVVPDLLGHNFFEIHRDQNPFKTAVISGTKSLNYMELDNQANQLAGYLISLGVTTGDVIGVCMDRSIELIVSLFGVLKAGACYLPIDSELPDDRIKFMYDDSGAKVLISKITLHEKFHNFTKTQIVLIDKENEKLRDNSYEKPALNIDFSSLSYIIYTSGSTGKPKGVKVNHRALVNWIQSMSKALAVNEDDNALAVSTPSFDMSLAEIFLALSNGATLFFPNLQEVKDAITLINLIDSNNITLLLATPSLWNILLDNGWKGKENIKGLCGGEALTQKLVRQILPKIKELHNYYGPTETTMCSTGIRITDPDSKITIGKPIDNTQIYILDKYNHLLPIGVTGELAIGGTGVSNGYINRPELTAEKFIPFEDGQIIYKTGDLARFLADGNIELFGRIDNQIKLRGFRIELGEIESLLSRLDGVKEAIVKLHKFEDNDERLVAFLNVDNRFKLTKEDIIGSLSQHLPVYMVPSFFQTSDGFPKLPNGKVNRKALILDIDESERKQEINFDSLSETQKKLFKIWENILKIKNIPPSGSFFDIGGNSLLAIRILNKIKEEFGFTMSYKSFIANPTIIQSGDYIYSQSQTEEKAVELIHLKETTNLPLSLNQKRLWLISKLQPDIPSYIISITYRFSDSFNPEIFQKSIDILFQRHHIVFSVIKEVNGEPYCDIVPSKVNIAFIDYSDLPESEKLEKVNDVFHSDSRKVFDLKNGPLYRLYLIKTHSDEYYFRMSIHHIVFDGWSGTVLANDLNTIYNSLLKREDVVLEKIEFQQYDYAQWEKESAGTEYRAESIEFWKKNLEGASTILNFPYDFQRKEQPSGNGSFETISLTKAMSDSVRAISKKEGSSLFTTLMSIFGIQMYLYSGENDLNIGLPVAFRPHSKLENIFGMFVNTVVVRLKYEKGVTFRTLIRLANDTVMNAIAHQDLPFEDVVEIVKPDRSLGANPLFQVALAWQNNLGVPIKLDGVVCEEVNRNERAAIFDIILFLWENEDIIEGEINYSTDLLKRETILRLKQNLLVLINNLVENPDTAIESFSMITDEDKKLILDFNDTVTLYPKDKTVAQLFEEQASFYSDKTAVVFKEESYTYKQLNEKSNQLARTLRNIGVKDNSPVGLMVEKSLDMIVGILGILKAGGGYVPIDPEYPEQRINFIIKDSGCKVLLMQDKYIKFPVNEVTKLSLNSPSSYHNEKSNINLINGPADLAYIMYTSGTTGVPKGSMIIQKNIVRLVRNTNYIELTPDDRILLTGAVVFDATTFEIWGSLLNGGSLYLVDKETILNPRLLGEEIKKNNITVLWLTSPLLTQIAETKADIFGNLNYLLTGGEVLSAPHINKVRKANPHLKVMNCYGPTENTTFSTTYLIEKDFEHNIPIGKPISNSTAYVFDKNMNYQPVGVIGELYVGGDGLSRGYLNREDLNNKSFVENPNNPGERLYKTGDYARMLPEGYIEFHGRIDNQLKVRGFRVELEEVEYAISELHGVIETVVKPIKGAEGDIRLVAFLNISDTFGMDTKELINQLRGKLPPYMIPSAFKYMHGFPKTVNGKTDKNSLTLDVNDIGIDKIERHNLETLTPNEKRILDIWSDILKTKDILITDNFFEIGGNSLLAISVMSKIESVFNIELGLRVFFDSPRIKDLAERIDILLLKTVKADQVKEVIENESKIIEGEI